MAKPSRGRRSPSVSGSSSRSSSRSRSSGSRSLSRSRSLSSSSSPSRSRSPPPRGKSSSGPARRGRSPLPPPQSKGASSPSKKAAPIQESLVLHVDSLSRNVNEGHLKEIFGNYGEVVHVELAMDRAVNLPKGYAYVEFKARADAEKALLFMDGGQIDGNVVKAKFTLPPRQKLSPPPKPVSTAPKREAPKSDSAAIEKDGPGRPRETSPRRRSPLPWRLPDSPPRRRPSPPIRRRGDTPPRRRAASPPRGRHLQGDYAVLSEDLQSADVADPQFVGLFALVQGPSHPAGDEVQVGDVEGHLLLTLVRQVPEGFLGRFRGAAVLRELATCHRKLLSRHGGESRLLRNLSSRRFKTRRFSTLQCLENVEEEGEGRKVTSLSGRFSFSDHWSPEVSSFHENGFSQISKETTGRAVHALCVKGLVRTSVLHINTLINMYTKFGRVKPARHLFDEMPVRNEASWNTMMSGLVRVGMYREGVVFFKEMCGLGVRPSGFVIASLVTACGRGGFMFSEGVQVHAFVAKSGLMSDVYVSTAVLHLYGVYGLVSCSRKVFEEMPVRNVVSWTSLMVGYSDKGEPEEVIDIYKGMRGEGVGCNENSMSLVISSCGLLKDESLGCQIIGEVIKSGLERMLAVENSLVSMFGNMGNVDYAKYIFDQMSERDTISWNSIAAAYAQNGHCEESLWFFHLMRHVHDEVNSTTVSTLLSVLGHVDYHRWGRGIHALVVKMGFDSVVCVCNTLLRMYAGAGRSEEAELVFKQMPAKDLISWNSLMACFVEDGRSLDALELLCSMIRTGISANYVSFTSALAACFSHEFLDKGRILHGLVMVTGLFDNQIIGNALVSMYGKIGEMSESRRVLLQMPRLDEVAWNALIGGYAEDEDTDNALEAFRTMRMEGVPANYITVVSVLGACLTPSDLLKHGKPLHAYIVSAGFESDEHVKNSLITMYAKCGDLSSSHDLFNRLENRNIITWNAMLAANAHHGHGEEVLKLVSKMRSLGLNLDQFSFSEGLSAAAKLAVLEEGQQLHGLAVKLGFEQDCFIFNAAADMYNKCGELNEAVKMLPPSVNRSLPSWNILISAFGRHGYFEKVCETFHEMVESGTKPGHVTFVSLLTACSHGGLVDQGLAYYDMIARDFGIKPAIEHCVCVIDLLGRSGRLAEAETFISNMPMKPNDLVWRSLLASCKIHGDLDRGRRAAEHLSKLEPEDDSVYVLSSNMFATTGRWEDVESVRNQMGFKNIKKKQACSWVKQKDKVSKFGIGDRTHPQTLEIYKKLEDIKKLIKESGYVADTSGALQDTDEEQKEQNLWNHSERLALAYALMSTPEGCTVRIFKNLRICSDCHSVYKFVSKVVGRRIVLRDQYRFHHFESGVCSCKDYW
ncbi:hypothetical protein DY000_02054961 [Brassica cretica]|uniref:RRM domain-containing protein n=2 Tax=Brassica cretica TaxID=69181 RepID=A0ABQ7A6R4_BRACR|nr:hypothetical protein DY000_02054961 [Brassica cretica]